MNYVALPPAPFWSGPLLVTVCCYFACFSHNPLLPCSYNFASFSVRAVFFEPLLGPSTPFTLICFSSMFSVDLHTAFSLLSPNFFPLPFLSSLVHCSLELQVVLLPLRNLLSLVPSLYRVVFTRPDWPSVHNHLHAICCAPPLLRSSQVDPHPQSLVYFPTIIPGSFSSMQKESSHSSLNLVSTLFCRLVD